MVSHCTRGLGPRVRKTAHVEQEFDARDGGSSGAVVVKAWVALVEWEVDLGCAVPLLAQGRWQSV